jgi:predicted HNH restriction endonuclease
MTDKKFPKIRGISRMDYEKAYDGWFVRYTRDAVTFRQTFPDSKYGSPEASLEAAKKWHEEARTLLPPLNRKEFAELKKCNNQSGHTGVHRSHQIKNGRKLYHWVASWIPAKGKKKSRRFSVLKYGEEEAKRLAIAAREEGIRNLEEEWPAEYWDSRRHQDSFDKIYKRDVFAFEGSEAFAIHKIKERNQQLRDDKISDFLEKHGELFCEVCGFSFEKEYGEIGKGLIEVHHLVPLALMTEKHQTTLSELICICSNCHFVVHNGDHDENLRKMKFIFDAKQTGKKKNQNKGIHNVPEKAAEID